ncbi:MAG: hypothetical protein HYR70_04330 [Chloroflexi bacterium]|nr:hypothetical protein [Chloroflexota bacterium]MBI3340784.1 hypothetical protein [Chloroflexota bacterium]
MFEFEIDFQKDKGVIWATVLIGILIAVIIGMAQIGRGVTPVDDAGSPRVLSWSDWRLLQAERAYAEELSVLRGDAVQLVTMLQQRQNPVAAQLLVNAIARHTSSGDPSLANARSALANASLNVRDWASGVLDRNAAIQSIQETLALLQ